MGFGRDFGDFGGGDKVGELRGVGVEEGLGWVGEFEDGGGGGRDFFVGCDGAAFDGGVDAVDGWVEGLFDGHVFRWVASTISKWVLANW